MVEQKSDNIPHFRAVYLFGCLLDILTEMQTLNKNDYQRAGGFESVMYGEKSVSAVLV